MKRVDSIFYLSLLFLIMLLNDSPPAIGSEASFSSNEAYAKVLSQYVHRDGVDYAALKKNQDFLNQYLESLAAVKWDSFKGWAREEQLAFLINYYNAQTLKLIVDHYPIRSIRDIGGWLMSPWKIPIVNLFGEKCSLDDLEHDIIRKDYEDPRIHFALVCAAKGCPSLRAEPYSGRDLHRQLEEQARHFLNDPTKNRIDWQKKKILLSPIFK